jgi:hypothetical protein
VSERPPDEPLTPAEERLLVLLLLLQVDEARSDPLLGRRVMESLRWQQAVRQVLAAIGGLAAAVGEGLATLAGVRLRRSQNR